MWRILHNKLPTDDNICSRGCVLVSMCNLCGGAAETADHLFANCRFAQKNWNWLSNIFNMHIDPSSFSLLISASKKFSQQVQDVYIAAIINCCWYIWYCRNMLRYESKYIQFHSVLNMIIASFSLSGNFSSGRMYADVPELVILKAFRVDCHPKKVPLIKQISWFPPSCSWLKCNTDGCARGAPGLAACGGIFRNDKAEFHGCFAINLGVQLAFYAELIGAIYAIEISYKKGWHRLWLECDSELVVKAFASVDSVPWQLRNRWKNCLVLTRNMEFACTHIYREGNSCADKIATHGLLI